MISANRKSIERLAANARVPKDAQARGYVRYGRNPFLDWTEPTEVESASIKSVRS